MNASATMIPKSATREFRGAVDRGTVQAHGLQCQSAYRRDRRRPSRLVGSGGEPVAVDCVRLALARIVFSKPRMRASRAATCLRENLGVALDEAYVLCIGPITSSAACSRVSRSRCEAQLPARRMRGAAYAACVLNARLSRMNG